MGGEGGVSDEGRRTRLRRRAVPLFAEKPLEGDIGEKERGDRQRAELLVTQNSFTLGS